MDARSRMTTLTAACLDTPAGPLALVADPDGALVAAGFCPVADLEARLHAPSRPAADLGPLTRAVSGYLAGDLAAVDDLPVAQPGSPYQQAVWTALRQVPAGSTISYGALAGRLGRTPGAARAVGSACGANLVAPVVPCHRVVRADGTPGGYYYGVAVKRWLLAHESGAAAAAAG